ncbi:tetratricopeptide repeat protein 37-like [Dendronephthya gigantea]|uniref:tetratricopeptide repeat protein 37-like n=1 Tax=Dendronephthya gigantea TaxID=151771 RepID=UPI00106A35F7|nr:tetratricopeptide repeat protein 37-like [Dendronephthya gigantea]
MASKEVKNELKSARESIQNKDYHAALKHCKAVLKLDKANYNAFVFVGVASIEVGKPEQALAAYKKAIEVNSDNILAWQGLSSLHEKEPEIASNEERIEVYKRLMKHYENDDKKKWSDNVLKLIEIYKTLKNVDEALTLLKLLCDADCDKDKGFLCCKTIDLLVENKNDLTAEQSDELINSYRKFLSEGIEPSEETHQYFQNYLNLLLDKMHGNGAFPVREVISEAKRMKAFFEKDEFALNLLARLYLGQTSEVDVEEAEIYEELLQLNPESPFAHFGLGKIKLLEKNFQEVEEVLDKGLQLCGTSSVAWYFMTQAQLFHHKYDKAFQNSNTGILVMKDDRDMSYNHDDVHFNLSFCKAKASSWLGKNGITNAIELLQELNALQPNNPNVSIELGRIFVRKHDLEEARQCFENVCNIIEKDSPKCLTLEGEIYAAQDEFENAEKSFRLAIELQQDVAENHLNLGKLYWKMEGRYRTDRDKCLEHLLKAAKLDSYIPTTFLYLGKYYETVGRGHEALRCYKKSHDLSPLCDETAEALVDAYMSSGQEEQAAELCRKFAVKTGVGRVKWAFLRLGLYHLKNEQFNDAVHCFQNALRVDDLDANTWECLGEAYMSRGSYTPALASFTRATELNPSLLYSHYQIAVVKHLLGLFEEAVAVYKTILSEHCDYVPALKGLGATYISYARSSLEQDFHGRALDYIQNAVNILARGIECDGSLSCVWKLQGDACSLVFNIHETKVRVELPESLRKFLKLEDDSAVTKMELLSLAASCFGQAVRYNSSCASLWQDVGLSYFKMSSIDKDPNERRKLCERSMKALKKALNIEPDNYIIWNTLGLVAASEDVNNPELSQHSFIKSIESQKNATAWTNLGVLYLRYGKADMANKAFNAAQCTDPTYTQAWIGQATIAEMFANIEAMDLYRHSNELGTHVEGYLGYANWVCHTLLPRDQASCMLKGKPFADLSHLPDKLKSVVLIASFGLTKYSDQIKNNPCAYNMHGILMEHQQLYSQAAKFYSCSLELLKSAENVNNDYCNIVRANYARVLRALGKYSESINVYQEISPLSNFHHITGLALSFLMLGDFQQSYQAYEQAFALATSEAQKSHVRAAMGMVRYMSNQLDEAKLDLCESSDLRPSSEQGLLALSALGLITSDITLAAAALAELVKIGQKGDENLISEASFLFASFYALQGSPNAGKIYIVKEIYRRPHSSLLWNCLAKFILRFQTNQLKEAGRCADAAHRLGDRNVEDVSITCAYSAIGSGRDPTCVQQSRISPGLISAQKTVHMRPDCLTNWALLSAAVTEETTYQSTARRKRLCELVTHFGLTEAIEAADRLLTRPDVFERRNINMADENQKWFALHYGYSLYYSGKTDEAIQHCAQALQIWSEDSSFTDRIKLLLVEINCRSFNDGLDNSSCLQDMATVLTLNRQDCYAWQFAGLFHEQHGFIKAAEFCYRNSLELSSREGLDTVLLNTEESSHA